MRASRLACARPPGRVKRRPTSFHSSARRRISLPLSPPIASRILDSTASRRTSSSISMATPHSVQLYRRFVCCSAKKGQHSIGTPPQRLSIVEFQPECVRNTPTASCRSTASCGHQLARRPRPWTASRNSGGSTAESPLMRSGRMIHRKSWPLLASPHANSTSSSLVITVTLPKLTNTTDRGALPSSQPKQEESSFHRLEPSASSGPPSGTTCSARNASGPMVWMVTAGGRMARTASSASCSSSSKVLRMRASASAIRSVTWSAKWNMNSSGSVERKNDGKSLSRKCLLIPGAQSTVVSKNPFVSCSSACITWKDALVEEGAVMAVAHVAAGAGSPEERARHAELPGGVEREAHDVVADDASDARRRPGGGVGVEVGEEAGEVREARLPGGAAERRHVLRRVGVGRRKAVGDGGEAEPREAVQRGGAPGAEEPAMVELGVDEGDVEAPAVEDLGQLQHRRDVALRRERQAHGVRLVAVGRD
uniref:Uncharacterized protein n=1 Tax=Oryza brachyantha TaxID=4533 RepID=J3LYF4_ORYBR